MEDKIVLINKTIAYIEQHLTGKTDLDIISRAVHYSKYHLHRTFKETVGITIHDYLQRRRITEAAKLLVFSSDPIMDIALAAGYETQQAFTNAFRNLYKQAPGQFREREEFYPLQLTYHFSGISPDTRSESPGNREIQPVCSGDIPAWMQLARLAIDGFPNLQEDEHIQSLKRYIKNDSAFAMMENGYMIGGILLCRATGSIDFMAVHPLYRSQGINRLLLDHALVELSEKQEIRITTYRDGDKADTGYRRTIKELGFAEGRLLTEMGYPTQEMIDRKSVV